MKHSTLARLAALLSVTLLFGAIKILPESLLSFTGISARMLTAQAGQAPVSQGEIDALKSRLDTLEADLKILEDLLNALPDTPPPPPPLSGIELVSTDGLRSFGAVPLLGSADKTFKIRNTSNRPVTFVGLFMKDTVGGEYRKIDGRTEALSFKDGNYPGTGGTCAPVITGECTIALSLSPRFSDAVETSSGLSYWKAFKAVLADGPVNGESNVFVTGGAGPKSLVDELKITLLSQPEQVPPGSSAEFMAEMGWDNAIESRQVFFKDVTVLNLTPPFFLAKNECAETGANGRPCRIRFSFRPTTSRTFRQTLKISADVGLEAPKEFTLEVSGTGLSRPDELSARDNLLVVYNESWRESIDAKNYYLENRPEFSDANTLGIRFPISPKCPDLPCLSEALEWTSYSRIKAELLDPVMSWIRDHPAKNIQYVVLMRGLPVRPVDADLDQAEGHSVQGLIRREAARVLLKEIFVTSVDTGSLQGTKKYIDKLGTVSKTSLLSARGTNVGGTKYYFSDSYLGEVKDAWDGKIVAQKFADAVKTVNPNADVITKGNVLPVLSSAADVTGMFLHGIYGYGNNVHYATDGTIRFRGQSGWYLLETAESFNGQWLISRRPSDFSGYTGPWYSSGNQGGFIEWFSPNAFGGSNYEYTPVAAVTHPLEPSFDGGHTPLLFACWESGNPFAYCAWKHDKSNGRLQAVGDPWVTR